MKSLAKFKSFKTLYGSLIVVLLWYLLHLIVNSAIVPTPHETLIAFIKLLQKDLLLHIGASLMRLIAALLISIAIGVPFGLIIGMSKKLDDIIAPVIYILYPIPKIAFLPVLMLLFGLGNTSKIILIITIIVFQILLGARDGVKEIDTQLFYSMKSLGLNKTQIYRNLVVPAVLPKIISSVRVSIGISISVLFFAENFAATYGLGYFIMNTWASIKYIDMFAGILALGLMGLLIFKLIDFLEKKLCPWIYVN
jgi:NitT/TauT family transport system permease protein